jgi:membrane protein implicated in regulation of membrane protease activity
VISRSEYLHRVYAVLGLVAIAVTLLVVAFGGDFLIGTLGLPPKAIGAFSLLLVVGTAVVVLWWRMQRNWSRRSEGSHSRKSGKQP